MRCNYCSSLQERRDHWENVQANSTGGLRKKKLESEVFFGGVPGGNLSLPVKRFAKERRGRYFLRAPEGPGGGGQGYNPH